MELPYLGAAELSALIGPGEAVDALERAFRDEDPRAAPLRSHLEVPDGELLLMPAYGVRGVGVKLVTLTRENPGRGLPFIHGVFVLFAPETQVPVAVLDGGALTEIRTAAVSALATRHLARPDARRLVVFGAGVQARAHVYALHHVCELEHVAIVARDPARAAALVAALRADGIPAEAAGVDAVRAADIVCTCTRSRAALFAADMLPAGVHVNAIGAYRPDMRELAPAILRRGLLVVETRDSALLEAGDIVLAVAEGELTAGAVRHELADVVRGAVGRTRPDEVTVFKSVGLALEDLAIAAAAADRLGEALPARG
jgi:ornithine cyclodeaminase